jgi:serine/threonine protein kinase
MALELGQTIDGKYRIVRLIGEGGMGAVYEGENVRIRRKVAIKLLHGGIASNAEMVQRFEREAQVAGTVGNDHILEILDLGALPNGDRYMVMEFLEGETLTERIKSRTRLQAADAVNIVRQMLTGLEAAHGAGIVHRDLKPDNIFVLRSKAGVKDFVKIIDFGISKFTEHASSTRMTRTGALMGTPHYMAPEQATGSTEIDRRTDIYAVGIILYEAVTGRVPFQAETFNQLLFEIALARITPARQIVPELDAAIDSIILKASARDPGQRFQTCGEFLAALDNWERTGSAVSLPPGESIEAIVAATVPRTGSMPMNAGGGTDATLSQPAAGGPVPSGSVPSGSVPGVSSPGRASSPAVQAAPIQPTLNTWANSSQAGVQKAKPPVLAATVLGVVLLLGGGTGAYFFLRSAPTPSAPAATGSPAETPPSAVPVATAAAPEVVPSPAVPVSPPVPSAPVPTPRTPALPVASNLGKSASHHAATPAHPTSPPQAPAAPPPPDKPTTKKIINFGY